MAEAPDIAHEQLHRALVERLTVNLRPVRRMWPVGARLGLWLILEALVLAWVVTHTHNDFMTKLEGPRYLMEVVLFAGAAIGAALIALRSAIPGRRLRATEIGVTIGMVLAGTGLVIMQPLSTGYPLSEFISVGRRCAIETCVLAAVPWVVLWWAVKRGAPMRGWLTGLAAGGASVLFSFAWMRLKCPIDERLHLLVWHFLPALAIALLSALAGAAWLRFRPRAS
jgi:hypothetical protein